MFFASASKNHPSGFSVSRTLAWNGLRSLRSAKNRKPFWNSYFAPCIMHHEILVVSFPLPHRFRFGLLFIFDRKYLTCHKIPQNDKTQYIPWEDRLLKSFENKAFFMQGTCKICSKLKVHVKLSPSLCNILSTFLQDKSMSLFNNGK